MADSEELDRIVEEDILCNRSEDDYGDLDDDIDEDALLADNDDDTDVHDDDLPDTNENAFDSRSRAQSTNEYLDDNGEDVNHSFHEETNEDVEEEDEEEEKQERNKFSSERGQSSQSKVQHTISGEIPDTLDEAKFHGRGGGSRGGGRNRGGGGRRDRLKWQQQRMPIMHLGSVKITPTRALFPHIRNRPPIFPLISMPLPRLLPFSHPSFPPPSMLMPPPTSMHHNIAQTATVHSSNQAYKSDDWLRLTEEFLNRSKSKGCVRYGSDKQTGAPLKRKYDSPRRRKSPSTFSQEERQRKDKDLSRKPTQDIAKDTSVESAEQLGLDAEYLEKLEKQKELRLKMQRQKEQRRMFEISKKQKEMGEPRETEPVKSSKGMEDKRGHIPELRVKPVRKHSPRRRRDQSKSPIPTKRRKSPSPIAIRQDETSSAWARRVMMRDKLAGGEGKGTLQGRKVILPQNPFDTHRSTSRTVTVKPVKPISDIVKTEPVFELKPVVHVNPALAIKMKLDDEIISKAVHLPRPTVLPPHTPIFTQPTPIIRPPQSSSTVTIAAVVRNATPSLTPQRMKIVAGTVGLVKSCSSPVDGIISIVFFDPKHAATFCQNYNGKKMDGTCLQIALEPYIDS